MVSADKRHQNSTTKELQLGNPNATGIDIKSKRLEKETAGGRPDSKKGGWSWKKEGDWER
jgi:hypothetical protein